MSHADPPPPMPTVVLLGASNLTIALPTALHLAGRSIGGPARFLVALGHGRSYGMTSRILCRSLPSIDACGLWDALGAGPAQPTYALVTDIGNDLGYGQPAARLVEWVRVCLDRLRGIEAKVVMTPLPMAALAGLSPRRYAFYRALLFPGLRLTREELLARAREADAGLRAVAGDLNVALAEHDGRWYGLDPIHIRRAHQPTAYSTMFNAWRAAERSPAATKPPLRFRRRVRRGAPQQRWVLGRERIRPQPCVRLADGSTLAMY